jgi:hypothetical protein
MKTQKTFINDKAHELGIHYGEEINDTLLESYPRHIKILIKTIKRLFNADIESSVMLYQRLLKSSVLTIFKLLQCKYMQNEEYQIYEIREQLIEDILSKEKHFFNRFKTNLHQEYLTYTPSNTPHRTKQNILEKYLSEFIIETFCFAEDFKTAWFNFFTEEFFDYIDRGEFDIIIFS